MKANDMHDCRPSRILHIIESSETGGAESLFLEIVKKIDKSKYMNFVGLFYKGWLEEQLISENIEYKLFTTQGAFDLNLLYVLIKYIIRNNIEIIHAHLLGANIYSSIAGTICGIPVVTTFHGVTDISKNDKLTRLKISILNIMSSAIVFVSEHLRKTIDPNNLFNNNKVVIVYNGIDVERFSKTSISEQKEVRASIGIKETDIVIGCVGDLREGKGYDTLMELAKLTSLKYDKVKFIIAGSITNNLKDLYLKSKLYKLNETVKFLGYIQSIEKVMNVFDIFLLPSKSEGFSLATIEAMSLELPVISTRCGGPEEIIDDHINGLLVDIDDYCQMFNYIELLINDDAYRNKIGGEGRKKVIKQFTVDRMINDYTIVYDSLVGR